MLPKQARGTSRKHVTKPFTQPAAPDCSGNHASLRSSISTFQGGVNKIPHFDCRNPKDGYALDEGPGRYYRVLDDVLWSEAHEGGNAVVQINFTHRLRVETVIN